MNTKIVILIPIVVAIISAYTFWSNRPAANPDRDGRSLAQPVLTLKKDDRNIEILIWGQTQYFTVTNDAGEILAERVTMDELTAQLPETAEQVGAGLADISADNSAGATSIKPRTGTIGNPGAPVSIDQAPTLQSPPAPLPDLQKEPSEESGVSSR